MEFTVAEIVGTISGGLIVVSGVVMYLKRLGFSFSKGNGNSNTFTRKEFMSKESKTAIKEIKEDAKLLQTKEICGIRYKSLEDKLDSIGGDVKALLSRGS